MGKAQKCEQKKELISQNDLIGKKLLQKAKRNWSNGGSNTGLFRYFAVCKRNTLPLSYSPFMHALVDLLDPNFLILIYTGTKVRSGLPMFCRPNADPSLVQRLLVATLH
jgi:hypothetical protein